VSPLLCAVVRSNYLKALQVAVSAPTGAKDQSSRDLAATSVANVINVRATTHAHKEINAKIAAALLESGRVTHHCWLSAWAVSAARCAGRCALARLQVIKEADIAKIVGELTEEQRSVKEARGIRA